MGSVLVIATLDTKGLEAAYVCECLTSAGLRVTLVDAGVLGEPKTQGNVSREEVFAAAGTSLEAVRQRGDRDSAVALAAQGVTRITTELHLQGKLQGILGLGGSAGTTIATSAMRALPIGVPKLMVSTLASGQVQPYVGTRDILMMPAVVDIAGLNRISRRILGNAAAAMAGMVQAQALPKDSTTDSRPLVVASMFGVTTPGVEAARAMLEEAGCEVLVFHATGIGGRTMEDLIRDRLIAGVLDLTTTELADELVGGVLSAGPDRLTAAALLGIPQVVSVGALDMVNFGPASTVPERFRHRRFHQHNPTVTLMRTTPEEMDRLGQEIAQKLSASRGPTALLLPLRGVSALDAEGQPFWWPEADQALFQSIRNWISADVELIELDLHINDARFGEAAARHLLQRMGRLGSPKPDLPPTA